jgi:hypothetical protein
MNKILKKIKGALKEVKKIRSGKIKYETWDEYLSRKGLK